MALEELQLIEQQIDKLEQEMANLLRQHEDAVKRLAEVPGLGVDSAQQIIAEVGAAAATFPSAKNLASWVGACPGDQESAEVSYSHRSPKGSRHMRRILNQAAHAAVKTKGSIFQLVYRRLAPGCWLADSAVQPDSQVSVDLGSSCTCAFAWTFGSPMGRVLHTGRLYEESIRSTDTTDEQ